LFDFEYWLGDELLLDGESDVNGEDWLVLRNFYGGM